MKKINNGIECKKITEADDRIKKSYHHRRDTYWFSPIYSPYPCYIYETDLKFTDPEGGNITGIGENGMHRDESFDLTRVYDSCIETINDYQIVGKQTGFLKKSIITEDEKKLQLAREACLKIITN